MKDLLKIIVAFCYCIATEYFLVAGDEVPGFTLIGALMATPLFVMVVVFAWKLHNKQI